MHGGAQTRGIRIGVAAMAVLSACRASDAPLRAVGEIDADAVPALALVEERRIGSLDDPNYGFSSIGGVQVDEAGNVYVSETRDREIRVYSASGDLIRRIGRAGSGPGEFETQVSSFGIRGDTVWAIVGSRINLFDTNGRVLSSATADVVTVPWHAEGATTRIVPVALDRDGLFIGDRSGTDGLDWMGAAIRDTVYIPRVRFNASGHVVDTAEVYARPRSVVQLVDVGRSQFVLPDPPTADYPRINLVDGSLRIISTGPGEFRIDRLDLSGERTLTRTFSYAPRAFPDSLLDAMAATMSRSGAANVAERFWVTDAGLLRLDQHAGDTAAARRQIRARMNWPEFQPPVQGTRFGSDGAVWLRRETTEGGETFRWLVLDENLLAVGELEVPRQLRIAWSGGDRLWAVENDEFGVPWLVGYRIQPAPG